MVPVSVSTASSPDKAVHRFVLKEKSTTVTLDDVAEGDWVKVTFFKIYIISRDSGK